ncbi:MAG: SufE family protein [Muribaculaceae bacterium]|nr:SufE family protein [Muribaculaceae bacterium]
MTDASIQDKERDIIDEFSEVDDWMDRYAMIIDMGNALEPLPDSLKTPDRLIEGCQSRVWLDATLDENGRIHYRADSDAIIVKGIISMLVDVLSDHTPDEILGADLNFIKEIGLAEHLSPTRSNGLVAMVKQMRAYAAAYKMKD